MIRASLLLLLALLPMQPLMAAEVADDELSSSTSRDPWERLNRQIYRFNQGVDRAFFKPLAITSDTYVPAPITLGIKNFFSNLGDVGVAINNLLQGKFKPSLSDGGRILVNSTMGLAGLFDVASRMGLEKHHEDFGQTLGKWGAPSGPYLVIPLFGPSSLRDSVGVVGDLAVDPVVYAREVEVIVGLFILRAVNTRSELLSVTDLLEQAALDPYAFERDSWLQKRDFDIRDGSFEDEDF
jgi:phospholipid-binding lipoprotein MlaA